MSRTQRTSNSSSPVKKYLSFSGGSGQVTWYDKNAPEDERKKSVEALDFIILDIKSSISGYHEATSKSISSNLLDPYSTGKEEFDIKIGGNTVVKGIWNKIKAEVDNKCKGAKFTTNIFALADLGNGLETVRLELNGAGLMPWINYGKETGEAIYDKLITITKGQLMTRKDGETVAVSDAEYQKMLDAIKKNPMAPRKVTFYSPTFTDVDLTEAQVDLAVKADEELQKYFDSIGVKASAELAEEASSPSPQPANDYEDAHDGLPF